MNVEQRKQLLLQLGIYLKSSDPEWEAVKDKASAQNPWFLPEFVDLAVSNIADQFLQPASLDEMIRRYQVPQENASPKKVGIVMAGNLPLVGFHDLLCCFITGHFAVIKLSSKDNVLPEHLVSKLKEWSQESANYFSIQDLIRGCDAYIATGNDNTARYFEYYFAKYPHIIRKNRTSVAILTGNESEEELEKLADDVHQFFGLGCRNVTKIYVPQGYPFEPLLKAFKKYDHLSDHNKYRNNYDYHLAIPIMNNKYYMTNGVIVMIEERSLFSPISQLNYEFYTNRDEVVKELQNHPQVQAIVGYGGLAFGQAQCPSIDTYADGIDTMAFLKDL
jgi:hypothetical protein